MLYSEIEERIGQLFFPAPPSRVPHLLSPTLPISQSYKHHTPAHCPHTFLEGQVMTWTNSVVGVPTTYFCKVFFFFKLVLMYWFWLFILFNFLRHFWRDCWFSPVRHFIQSNPSQWTSFISPICIEEKWIGNSLMLVCHLELGSL